MLIATNLAKIPPTNQKTNNYSIKYANKAHYPCYTSIDYQCLCKVSHRINKTNQKPLPPLPKAHQHNNKINFESNINLFVTFGPCNLLQLERYACENQSYLKFSARIHRPHVRPNVIKSNRMEGGVRSEYARGRSILE